MEQKEISFFGFTTKSFNNHHEAFNAFSKLIATGGYPSFHDAGMHNLMKTTHKRKEQHFKHIIDY